MYKTILKTLTLVSLFLLAGCAADDDPPPSCEDAGEYAIPVFAEVVMTEMVSDTSNATFWVCEGGSLTLNGNFNTVVASAGSLVVLNGNENIAYALGESELEIYGNEQTAWLNGDSKTTVKGVDNLLYYWKTGVLLEYGTRTIVEDICGNVEIDFSNAPIMGCQ